MNIASFINQILLIASSFILAVLPAPKYVEGVVGQPRSFLPNQAVTQTDKTISKLIFRGLFKYDIYGILVPDLAESWSISEDGLVYTIKMKDNQMWSDKRKITADDLIYTSFKVNDLSGIATDKVDDLTVRFTLPNKFSPFLSLMTIGVMPSGAEENFNSLTPVSSGPFKVLRIEKSGPIVKQVTLYNLNKDAKFKKLLFKYYSSIDEVETAAKLGEIDGFISSKDYNLDNFAVYNFPVQSVYYALFFNLSNEKLQKTEFRQKLEKVLPIDALVMGKGIPVEGAVSRSIFTNKNLTFNKYDKTFEEIKNETTKQTIILTVPDLKVHKDLASEIKRAWEDKLNVNIIIRTIDPGRLDELALEKRNFEVLLYGQEIGRDPDRYVNWHSTQKDAPGLNISGFEQVRADRALEEGRKEVDDDKRVVHYNEFQKVINDQVPAIFLYHPYDKYYVSKYITGIGEKYTFTDTDRFLDFNNWQRIVTN